MMVEQDALMLWDVLDFLHHHLGDAFEVSKGKQKVNISWSGPTELTIFQEVDLQGPLHQS